MYLLNLFCDENAPQDTREKTASLLGMLTCDRLLGPRIRLQLQHELRLPLSLIDQLRDEPAASLHTFTQDQENPDLIWTQSSRLGLKTTVETQVITR